eukprot:SAG11_NODE_359_length_10228_cov_7.861388_6_plen_162_part_00
MECFSCGKPRPPMPQPALPEPARWSCPKCGFDDNYPEREECFSCGEARLLVKDDDLESVSPPWSAGGSFHVPARRMESEGSSQTGTKPPEPARWSCPKCGFDDNYPEREECFSCGEARLLFKDVDLEEVSLPTQPSTPASRVRARAKPEQSRSSTMTTSAD